MGENRMADMSTEFAIQILKSTDNIKGHFFLVNQIERSATFIGANVRNNRKGECKMKRFMYCFICMFLIFSFVGCNSDSNISVLSGNYYAVGDYEETLTPYLWLDTDKNEFYMGAGTIVSYAEYGTYEIVDDKIIATSQNTTFEFEIKDKNTLVLIDNGDNEYFKISINTKFVFSKEQK